MASSIVGFTRRRKKKRLYQKCTRRQQVRQDLTPMVDIAFLLLIFYMVTTVFRMPQAMEIVLPPDDDVPVHDVLTIRVDSGENYWWNTGTVSTDNLPELLIKYDSLQPFDTSPLFTLLEASLSAAPKIPVLILIHRDAGFEHMVHILDEFDLVERSINPDYYYLPNVSYLWYPDADKKFSVTYGIGEWSELDSKIIAEAENRNL